MTAPTANKPRAYERFLDLLRPRVRPQIVEQFLYPGQELRHMIESVCTLIDIQQDRIEILEKQISKFRENQE